MDYKSYKLLLEDRRRWYKTIGKVYCPCLKEDVIFNSKGFYHIMLAKNGKTKLFALQKDISGTNVRVILKKYLTSKIIYFSVMKKFSEIQKDHQ